MSHNTHSITSKVWSFCNPLRDVGVGYGDYLEQITYLLFLKMETCKNLLICKKVKYKFIRQQPGLKFK